MGTKSPISNHQSRNELRVIPSIEELRQHPSIAPFEAEFGREAVLSALRDAAAALREALAAGRRQEAITGTASETVLRDAAARLASAFRPSLRRVINATGVIVHTNLGRAPLADAALARLRELGPGYSNLEYDLQRGSRGSRTVHAEALLTRLTGAEAAAVVNNNASATLLMLAALAAGREVIISRGELVEIGGGFRIPDVLAQSRAVLREVGTTNRTRVADYAAAIGERTALILRVHPSNFRIEGFTERPSLESLVALGRQFSVPVVEDLGSGAVIPLVTGEPVVSASIGAGADVVCFSGDKLLGGPQAGILVGGRAPLQTIRSHPLMRALRVDKLTYAVLEATLIEYLSGRARETVPVVRMLSLTMEQIEARARSLAARIETRGGWQAEVIDGHSTIGGGRAPRVELPTRLIALSRGSESAEDIERFLRHAEPPIIARIHHDRVVIDLRTVAPEEDDIIVGVALGATA